MTESTETSEKYDYTTDPHGYTEADVLGSDVYLDWFLRVHFGDDNSTEAAGQLTLVIDGALVSGVAISAKEWSRRMAETLGGANTVLSEAFAHFSGELLAYTKDVVSSRNSEGRPLAAFQYIYMRNVRISTGSSVQMLPLWRAKVSEVSGWTIGSTNTPEEVNAE